MTITNYEDLHKWYFENQKDEGATPVHWTLYGGDYGQKEVRLMANQRTTKPEESFDLLRENIRRMNNPEGTKFRVQIYRPGAQNNYSAQAYIQIYSNQNQTSVNAAITGLPAIYGGPEGLAAYINDKVELERLKRENEELKEATQNPSSQWERILGIIADSPNLSNSLGQLITSIMKGGALAAPITGTPPAATTDTRQPPTSADAEQVFTNNMNIAAAQLGTDWVTLSERLKNIVSTNPDVARQIFNS